MLYESNLVMTWTVVSENIYHSENVKKKINILLALIF